MGSIYRRTEPLLDAVTQQPMIHPKTGKAKRVPVGPWWIKFYQQGRPFRESTGTLDHAEAKKKLQAREGDIAKGEFAGVKADRLKYDALAADLRVHYETTGSRVLKEADVRLKPLAAFFNGYPAKR